MQKEVRGFMNKFDDSKLYQLLEEKDFRKIDAFLKKYGADSVDRDGRTFLMSAIVEQKIELVKHLISLSCNVNASDIQGLTPLHFAAIYDNEAIASLLVEHGANIDAQDDQGNTPLWRAVMENDAKASVAKYLISVGADMAKENNHGVSPSDLM